MGGNTNKRKYQNASGLVDKCVTNASGAAWWTNFKIQVRKIFLVGLGAKRHGPESEE